MKRRAERQAETRQRIVEAAVDLHGSVGPSRTTFSMVAERAGVQRHTLYAHFPDERSLYLACSGLVSSAIPCPRPTPGGPSRIAGSACAPALAALYDWYERNAELTTAVLRDAEHDPLLQEIQAMRVGPTMAAYCEVLRDGLAAGSARNARTGVELSSPGVRWRVTPDWRRRPLRKPWPVRSNAPEHDGNCQGRLQ